jgi:hypothetical protein
VTSRTESSTLLGSRSTPGSASPPPLSSPPGSAAHFAPSRCPPRPSGRPAAPRPAPRAQPSRVRPRPQARRTRLQPRRRAPRPLAAMAPDGAAAGSADRRTPVDRSSPECRNTHRAASAPRHRSARPPPRPSLLRRAPRAPLRSTRDGRAWRCSRTRSRSTPSCRRSARSRRTRRFLPPGRAQGYHSERRDRRRDAGRRHTGARDRTQTAAIPGHRQATSRRGRR